MFGWLTLSHQPWTATYGSNARSLCQTPSASTRQQDHFPAAHQSCIQTTQYTYSCPEQFICVFSRSIANSASSKCLIVSVLQVTQSSPRVRLWRLFGYFLKQAFKKNGCPKSEIKDQHAVIQLNVKESPFGWWKTASLLTMASLNCLCMPLGHNWSLYPCSWIQVCSYPARVLPLQSATGLWKCFEAFVVTFFFSRLTINAWQLNQNALEQKLFEISC